MKTVLKRILSLVLSLCLLIGFVPAVGTAHAAPSGLNLTYTGQDQALVTAEPGYTYSLRADGPFDDAAPTATAVGRYFVHCKSKFDGTVICVTTDIRPVAVPPTIFTGLEYNGNNQIIAKAADNSSVFVDGGAWGKEATASNAGTYTVYYKTSMYGIDSEIGQTEVTIAPKRLLYFNLGFAEPYSGKTQYTRQLDLMGVCSGDDVRVIMDYEFESAEAGSHRWQCTAYRFEGSDAANYTINLDGLSGTDTIVPLPITVTAKPNQSKTYLDAEPAAFEYTLSTTDADDAGFLETALAASPLRGALSREEGEAAGSYAITLGTLANPNYDITFVPADFVIKPYTLNISGITAADKVYDGTTDVSIDESGMVIENLPADHTASAINYSAEFESSAAGDAVSVVFNPGTPSITNAEGEQVGSSFALSFAPVTGKIAPAEFTIKDLKLKPRYYDGSDTLYADDIDDSELKISSPVDIYTIEFAEKCGKYDSRHAGKDKPVTLDPEKISIIDSYGMDITDSLSIELELSGEIRPIGFGYAIDGASKTYDGSTAANISLTPYTLHPDDELIVSFSAAYADKNVGSPNITLSNITLGGAQAGNYLMASSFDHPGQIFPADLNIVPDKIEIEYLDEEPAIGYKAIGLIEGDTLTGALSREAGSTPGSYAVNLGTLYNPNYSITISPADFVITNREILVSGLSAADKVYDGSADADVSYSAVTFSNVPAGYDFSTFKNLSLTASFADANAGEDKPVSVDMHLSFDEGDQPLNMQYFDFVPESLTASISPAPVELTVDKDEKTFGDDEPKFSVTAPESLVIGREEGEDADEYDFVILSGASGNYDYSFSNSFTVKPASILDADIKAKGSDKTYTGAKLELLDSLSIRFDGETLAKGSDFTLSGNEQSKLGEYTVTVSGISNFTDSKTYTYSILPPEIIDDVLDEDITPENVSLDDKAALLELAEALATIDEDTVHDELDEWEEAAELLPPILAAIEKLEASLELPDTSEADAINPNTLKEGDRDTLEAAAEAVEEHLDKYGDVLDPEVKEELEEKLEKYEKMLKTIDDTQDFIDKLRKWLKKYLPVADADELWLRAEYRKYINKIKNLPFESRVLVFNTFEKELDTMKAKLYTYYIIGGHLQTWLTDSKEGAKFVCNGHIDLFRGVYVDGKLVDSKYYTVKSGSTILEFSNEFMKTLEKGTHQIQFKYEDSYSTIGLFYVSDFISPRTADDSDMALWLSLLLTSAAGIYLTLKRKKEFN